MKWSLLLLPCLAWASVQERWSERWSTVVRLAEQHESYVSGEMIKAPQGTWQLLFSAIIAAQPPAGFSKDCVWVRVPEAADGQLQIVTVKPNVPCKESQGQAPSVSVTDLKGIQFELNDQTLQFWLTEKSGRVAHWKTRLLNYVPVRAPELHQPSASRGVFYFVPNATFAPAAANELVGELGDRYPQHPCSFTEGTCQRCRYGVYRVSTGETYCGVDRCGEKNQPACWRGTHWQRSRDPLSCRTNDSLVFCSPGLRVECEGERALCR